MNGRILEHFRCPGECADLILVEKLSSDAGFFRFGVNAVCYGQSSSGFRAKRATDALHDVLRDVITNGSTVYLPFDPAQVLDNLRYERYRKRADESGRKFSDNPLVRRTYYLLRPLLSVSVRKHLQRVHLNRERSFPVWPIDGSADRVLQTLLALLIKSRALDRIPFVWFWPDGFQSCLMMTHDVETKSGRDFCSELMDMDDSFAVKSSFGVVPEKRYPVSDAFLDSIRQRGFELHVHDLNHDGQLFASRQEFLRRSKRINRYAKQWGATGFRSGALYREPDWYDALQFEYDMSIPNSGHLEAQRGGCCTVMPYFIGDLVELPLTTIEDYSLFNILDTYSIDLWKDQIACIGSAHGLISFIVHPDYIRKKKRALDAYKALLQHISDLRVPGRTWVALPTEVNHWWRQRSRMTLVGENGQWRIEGEGSERARIAYASLDGDALRYTIEPADRDSREENRQAQQKTLT